MYPYMDSQTIHSKLSLVGKVTFLEEFLPNVCEPFVHHLFIEVCAQQEAPFRDFLDCQRLRLYLPMQGLIPGERAKIPHTSWQNKQTNKQKNHKTEAILQQVQ